MTNPVSDKDNTNDYLNTTYRNHTINTTDDVQATNEGNSQVDIESYTSENRNRIAHLRTICLNYEIRYSEAFTNDSFMRSAKYNFTVCKVPKVRSTFWVQLMSVIERGIKVGTSLFSKMRSRVHGATDALRTTVDTARHERTILISRDPYSRIFSAYIDKIYLPIMFSVNFRIRGLPYNKKWLTDNCPIDVSFQEFLENIVMPARGHRISDQHWNPISATCHPCEVKPFLLVKQESFAKDVELVLHAVNVTQEEKALILGALKGNRIELTLPGLVETVYGYAKKYQCEKLFGMA